MTPFICIQKRHRCNAWLTVDMRDEDGVDTVVVIPAFGPNHRAGTDCWCQPNIDEGVIVHNECH